MIDQPVPPTAGISSRHDRMWGLIGAVLGVLVGVGSAAIAVLVEGAGLFESGPYPAFFARRQLLVYDVFLALVIAVGAGIAVGGILLTRRGKYPRTDALGALLCSPILTVLGGALLFVRLFAVTRGV